MNCFTTPRQSANESYGSRQVGVAKMTSVKETPPPQEKHFGTTDSGYPASLASTTSSDSSLQKSVITEENQGDKTKQDSNFSFKRSYSRRSYHGDFPNHVHVQGSGQPIQRRASSHAHKTYAVTRAKPRAHSVAAENSNLTTQDSLKRNKPTKNTSVKYITHLEKSSSKFDPGQSEIFITAKTDGSNLNAAVNQVMKSRPHSWTSQFVPPNIKDLMSQNPAEITEQQLQAYVVWVNCQLKKKPGTRPVHDLGSDMQDGVALAHLIEILALEKLEGIHVVPSGVHQMLENVEKVIQFMVNRRIRMHHTTAKDIVEGNIKSIMRLILAVAAHFKPNSVKQAPPQHGAASSLARGSPRGQSVTGIAQGAANTLAEARQEVANIPHRPRRPWQLSEEHQRGPQSQQSDSDRSGLISRSVRSRDREELEGASSGSSPRSSATGSPRIQRRLEYPVPKSRSQDFTPGHDDSSQYVDEEEMANQTIWDDLLEERGELVDELDETKSALLKLQELLLNGEQPDGDLSNISLPVEGESPHDEVVILKSKLQQTEHLCRELRDELSRVKSDCMELQGAKAGSLSRLSDKEKALTQLNREVLRLGFAQQSLETEKVELEKQLQEKDRVIAEYKKEILHRDRQIEDLVSTFHMQQQEKEKLARSLRSQIFELHERLKLVGETEASLAARVASQDRKMAWIENRITHTQVEPASSVTSSRPSSSRSAHSDGSSEMQVVRDTLQTLRSSLTGSDPQQQAIDRLEQSIANLMDKLVLADHPASHLSDSSSPGRGRINYDSTGDIRRSPITSIQGYPVQRLEADSSTGNKASQSTKILYFTDRTVTPFMCTIGKRLGEVRLRDIKAIFDRQGLYRYHFKAMDPEFGTVKEEITLDDAIIPGWEGKIVAWIEEDDR